MCANGKENGWFECALRRVSGLSWSIKFHCADGRDDNNHHHHHNLNYMTINTATRRRKQFNHRGR